MSYLKFNESFKTMVQQVKDFSFDKEKRHINKHDYFNQLFDRTKVHNICEKMIHQYAHKVDGGLGGISFNTHEMRKKNFDPVKLNIKHKEIEKGRKEASSLKDHFDKMTISFPVYLAYMYKKGTNDKNDMHQSTTCYITFDSNGCHSAKANIYSKETGKPTMTEIPGLKEAINRCKRR